MLVGVTPLAGCFQKDGDSVESFETHLADFEALREELMKNATKIDDFSGTPAIELVSSGERLWYAVSRDYDPDLYNYIPATGNTVNCGAIAGSGATPNFRASDVIAVTADEATLSIHDPDSCELLTTVTLPPLVAGQKWWAYAVDGEDVYAIVESSEDHLHTVMRWRAGNLEGLGTLEDAGYQVDTLFDFSTDGKALIYHDLTGIFELDMASWKTVSIGNEYESEDGTFNDDYILYRTGNDRLMLWDRSGGATRNVGEEIETLSVFNEDFDFGQYRGGHATLYEHRVLFTNEYGIMMYDLDSSELTPLMLNKQDGTLSNWEPVVAGDVIVFGRTQVNDSGYPQASIWSIPMPSR